MNFAKIMKRLLLPIVVIVMCIGSLHASYKKEDMLFYVRTKPLKTMMPKLMRFAKEIVDNRQFDAYIAAFGILLGHPNYEGLSAKDGIMMFAFDDNDKSILFMAKFTKNSPMKTDFIKNGLSLKDIREWTFISSNREALNELSDVGWMIDIADSDMKNDMEICPSVPKLAENMNIDAFKNGLEPEFKEQIDRVAFAFYTLRDEFDELHQICLAGNFDDSTTTISIHAKAKAGSNIGSLWSAEVGGTTKLPQLVFEKDPCFSAFVKGNPKANRTFSDKLNHKILKNCNYTDLDILWKKIMEKSQKLANKPNGQCVLYLMSDENALGVVAVSGGKYESEDVKAIMDCDADVAALIEPKGSDGSQAKFPICGPFTYKSQYTYRKEMVYSYDLCGKFLSRCWYACACKGNFIMATSKVLLEKAVDNILDNRTRISLEGDNLLQASVNIKQIANDILGGKNGASAKYNGKVNDLKPIKVYTALGNNRYTTYVTFDNISVREFGKMLVAAFNFGAKASNENETCEEDKAAE
jgi:hypothetical protein